MSASHDLQHFLRLAQAQARTKATRLAAESTQASDLKKVRLLRLLDELIKEQLPNEDSGTATRPTR